MSRSRQALLQRKEDAERRAMLICEQTAVLVVRHGRKRLGYHLAHPNGSGTLCGISFHYWTTFRKDVRAKPRQACFTCVSKTKEVYGESISRDEVASSFNTAHQKVLAPSPS